jgi:hypothetical protein
MIKEQLFCPECNATIVIEIVKISRQRYEVLNQVPPDEVIPLAKDKPSPPTFNVAIPVALPTMILKRLRCTKCDKIFNEATTDIDMDHLWSCAGLYGFRPDIFKIQMKTQSPLKLNYRPKI